MLELSGLKKRYGPVVALDDVDLVARPGRIVGFLGPNGAGKTTAMRSIFGLVALDEGAVAWEGAPVTPSTRRLFGYLPEHRGLYPKMKVGSQIAWFGRIRGMSATGATAAARAWLDRLGLGERIDDKVEALSHGNKQRVQLAASLVHDPRLLILDEPFSGLDPVGTDAMIEVLRGRAADGITVLLSSHQLDLVEGVCDEVAIIHSGRMVLSGSIDEVRSDSPYRRLEVSFAEGAGNWAPPGGELRGDREGVHTFMVPADSDPTSLLASATRMGRVTSFSFEPPRLSEIFREAVKA
jgi:ABC-2 type transport system ATP-binding protein